MKNIKYLFGIIVVVTLLGCSEKKTTEANKVTDSTKVMSNSISVSAIQYKNMDLGFDKISQSQFSDEIAVTGMSDVPPENVASISLPIAGFIKTMSHNVLPGKFIAKGGVLATVQSMEFVQLQQDYLQAVFQGDYLEKELERQKILANEDATAKKKLQLSESEYNVNRALVKSLSAKLKILGLNPDEVRKGEIQTSVNIISPIAGYIKSSNVNIGKNITPSDVLFEIINKDHLHLELKVFEKDAYKISEGQKVIFNDPKLGGEVSGKVFLIGKSFEGETKAVNIHVHLDNEKVESRILPGMFINAKILTGNRPATTLPESAIIKKGNSYYLYILESESSKEYIFKKVNVQIGSTQSGKTEVILPKDFDINANVVVKGINILEGIGSEGEEE
ncbi:MAG: efflux RND transporter periplasmic adaptor subunit [Spirosomaceae bacterium]|jgi:cobalt-zinc-cadmium efflux system membrane fusion protein|nr:efflux RND transporter periplasmic adaptor subunit [Spirosomataceae bacterium]